MRALETDVLVVGAGPAGLMLAVELCLTGVRPLVVERQPRIRDTPRALGVGGQILHLLRYRGLLGRLEAANTNPIPAPRFPFGGVHLDFTTLADPPMPALPLAQPQVEAVLDECARDLGADIRRGHEVTGVDQDDASVTADIAGPEGRFGVAARYLVGCDGPRSRIRAMAGIPFPGVVYPEVNRLGQVAVHDSVTRLDNGDLEVPGAGRVRAGFTRTERGVFGLGALSSGELMFYTSEDDPDSHVDDPPMPVTELQDSIRRVLGVTLPMGDPSRLSRFTFEARQADRYRAGRILLAGDAAHLFPATGIALNAGMLDAVNLGWKLAAEIHGWAPAGLLDTYHDERHLAGERTLLHTRAQVALRRGLDPAADALRELFSELLRDEQPLRRMGALLEGDIRYPMPGAAPHALAGVFAPDLAGELLHDARPVFLDLADRADLRRVAEAWRQRITIHTATADERRADALLIRPDAHSAWAATLDEPTTSAASGLQEALRTWFGDPGDPVLFGPGVGQDDVDEIAPDE